MLAKRRSVSSAIVWSARPACFFCTLGHTYILGDPLYFKVIALNLIMKHQEVEGVATGAPHLEVGEEHLSRDVSVECL